MMRVWQRRKFVIIGAVALISLAIGSFFAVRANQGPARTGRTSASPGVAATPVPPPAGWVRHIGRLWPQSSAKGSAGGISVSIDTPKTWHFNDNPVPALLSPTMLFAVGTGPVPTGGNCAPTAALKALPANGALFVLYGYSQPGRFSPRRERLHLGSLGGPYECWGVKGYIILFKDHGRGFQAQVVFGPRAPASLRAEMTRSLNTLHVQLLPAP